MAVFRKIDFVLLVVLLSISLTAFSNTDLASKQKALKIIGDFAERICGKIPLTGSSESLELSGEAKAEFNSLLKKIADIGIKGAAKYEKSEYKGALQRDLVELVKNSTDCKMQIWKDLENKFIDSTEEQIIKEYATPQYAETCNTDNPWQMTSDWPYEGFYIEEQKKPKEGRDVIKEKLVLCTNKLCIPKVCPRQTGRSDKELLDTKYPGNGVWRRISDNKWFYFKKN